VWVEALGTRFEHALDLLRAAVRGCNDELWHASMWEVPIDATRVVRGADGHPVVDPDERHVRVQNEAAPWGVAWHALERLDFLLTGGFVPWRIWPPLAERFAERTAAPHVPATGVSGHTGLDIATMNSPWTRSDVLAYLEYCRRRVDETLDELTDDKAATLVGRKTYAARLMQAQDHVVEHAAQIRQFITTTERGHRS
jgi:hypothetical protein